MLRSIFQSKQNLKMGAKPSHQKLSSNLFKPITTYTAPETPSQLKPTSRNPQPLTSNIKHQTPNTMASMNSINRPHPSPPSPTPDQNTTVIVVVFVSLGCVLFLAFLAFVLWFLIKKKSKKQCAKSETVRVDEHFKMKEAKVEGPHGTQSVVLSVEDDVRIEDMMKKDEKEVGKVGEVGTSVRK